MPEENFLTLQSALEEILNKMYCFNEICSFKKLLTTKTVAMSMFEYFINLPCLRTRICPYTKHQFGFIINGQTKHTTHCHSKRYTLICYSCISAHWLNTTNRPTNWICIIYSSIHRLQSQIVKCKESYDL